MNAQPNDPTPMDDPDRPPPQGALPVWIKVYSKPGERTFSEIISHPDATAKNAYIWVFIAGTLSGLINGLVQVVAGVSLLRQIVPGYDQLPDFTGVMSTSALIGSICGAPIAGLMSVIGFAITVAVLHWAARFFGSKDGSFDQLAYAMGAVVAPFTLVSALLLPLNLIPFAAFCLLPLLLVLSVYVIFLQVAAVKTVYRTGWFEAAGAYFLPTILIVFLCACAVLGVFRLLGPSVNDVFRQVQQGL